MGRFELGALSIRQAAFGAVNADTLSVVRAKMGVLNESSVGVIATHGDPTSNRDNTVAGADFQYRNTHLAGGRTLETDLWYEHSDTEGVHGDDAAYGVSVRLPSRLAAVVASLPFIRKRACWIDVCVSIGWSGRVWNFARNFARGDVEPAST